MDTLTDILDDIYRLDPALKEQDEAVRALVSELLAKRPTVVPDQAFAKRLRAELVSSGAVVAGQVVVPSPWYFYAAPAGVFALLLLMLVPQFVTSPTAPVVMPENTDTTEAAPEATSDALFRTTPAEETLDVPMGGGASMKSMGGGAPEAAPAQEEGMSLMALPASDEAVNSLYVAPQRPGSAVRVEQVYATVPALVVVYRGAEVIGVSGPVAPGIPTEASVVLSLPATAEEELTAVLYADIDGDSIFTPGTDTMLTDPYGAPIQQTFIVTNRLF